MATAATRSIKERYRLLDPLGRGGMGVVWRARDEVLGREVAVKEVELPAAVPGEERDSIQERVLREARAAAALNHPNAITVYDVIKIGDRSYIVMELVDAPTLEKHVQDNGPMGPREAARIGVEIAAALEAAHAAGITHRDVKPSNVMLLRDGTVKLADFGIASIKGDPKITTTGLILGSPSFMAPEQALETAAGAECDVWGLGATLHFAVEGIPPFDRGQAIATLTAVIHEALPTTRSAGALGPVIQALMRKEPGERPSPAQAKRLLETVAAGASADTVPAEAFTPTQIDLREPETSVAEPARVPARETDRRSSWWLAALGAAAIALLAAVLLLPQLGDDEPSSSNEPRPAAGQDARRSDVPEASKDAVAQGPDASAEEASGSVPEGWSTYTDPATGYEIGLPDAWSGRTGDGNTTDFSDPASGAYLRVEWTDAPGPDAYERLAQQAESFGSSKGCYENLGVEPTTFAGTDNAAIWEYTYCEGGAQLHAYNLQFVLPDGSYGFALNLQSQEDDWADVQDEWEGFQATYVPPGS